MTKINEAIINEFKWDDAKLLQKLTDEKKSNFAPSLEFKQKMDVKIQDKIQNAKMQKETQEAINAVPSKLKRRFYMTGFWYAVWWFFVLFLIGFCTNIFTGNLDIPQKYTYLEEPQAFWNLDDVVTIANEEFDSEELGIEESIDLTQVDTKTSLFTNSLAQKKAVMETVAYSEDSDLWVLEEFSNIVSYDSVYNPKTYRFSYKSKLFPKLDLEYPVFKVSWVMLWNNSFMQKIKNLKIWDVSLKNLDDISISSFELKQQIENWYSIVFNSEARTLDFYPNPFRESKAYYGDLPNKKQLLKNVELWLKNLWISLKNYWEWNVKFENFDSSLGAVQIFYPLIIGWKSVRSPESNEQIWINVNYSLSDEKIISIVGIDISSYIASNYPIQDKNSIENNIEKWGDFYSQWALHEDSTVVLFDSMEIVYMQKSNENNEIYYVPAIRWTISTSIEDYSWPRMIFQEISNFYIK